MKNVIPKILMAICFCCIGASRILEQESITEDTREVMDASSRLIVSCLSRKLVDHAQSNPNGFGTNLLTGLSKLLLELRDHASSLLLAVEEGYLVFNLPVPRPADYPYIETLDLTSDERSALLTWRLIADLEKFLKNLEDKGLISSDQSNILLRGLNIAPDLPIINFLDITQVSIKKLSRLVLSNQNKRDQILDWVKRLQELDVQYASLPESEWSPEHMFGPLPNGYHIPTARELFGTGHLTKEDMELMYLAILRAYNSSGLDPAHEAMAELIDKQMRELVGESAGSARSSVK